MNFDIMKNEVPENKNSSEGYKEIKPEKSLNPKDRAEIVKDIFDSFKSDNVESVSNDLKETKSEMKSQISEMIGTKEGLEKLREETSEKTDLWGNLDKANEILNNPDSSPLEVKRAQGVFNNAKGQILELACKKDLADCGFDVEEKQKINKGESGDTKPDVVATNNTDKPIDKYGYTVNPGETISVECKCGSSTYLNSELEKHIPNQLSGQEGNRVLLTTSDITNTKEGLADSVCKKYDAKLVVLNIKTTDVENSMKEV